MLVLDAMMVMGVIRLIDLKQESDAAVRMRNNSPKRFNMKPMDYKQLLYSECLFPFLSGFVGVLALYQYKL
jgi:hypothetical protein